MNRRAFFKGLGTFMILAPATTYSRIWKATREEQTFEWTYAQLDQYGSLSFKLAKWQQQKLDNSFVIAVSPEAYSNLLEKIYNIKSHQERQQEFAKYL